MARFTRQSLLKHTHSSLFFYLRGSVDGLNLKACTDQWFLRVSHTQPSAIHRVEFMSFFLSLSPIALITTTVGTQADAENLAQGAVQAKLAACAQREPITSHYVWQGQLEHSAEWRVVFKTLPDAVPPLWQWLQTAHPYEVPQLLLRTEQADAAYAAWVSANVDIKMSC